MLCTHVSERDTPLLTASSTLLVCLCMGQLVLAGIGAVMAFRGVARGKQARLRRAGEVMFLSGLLVILVGMIFSTGFEIGNDLARRVPCRRFLRLGSFRADRALRRGRWPGFSTSYLHCGRGRCSRSALAPAVTFVIFLRAERIMG